MKKIMIFIYDKRDVFQFLLFFFLTFFLFKSMIVNNQIPVWGDMVSSLDGAKFAGDSIKSGHIPVWNYLLNAGRPYVMEFAAYILYPFRWPFLLFDMKWYFYSFYAFHLALGVVFTRKYLESIDCTEIVAFSISCIYYFTIALGGYRKMHLGAIATMTLFPTVLFFIEKYYRTKKLPFLMTASLILALQTYLGALQWAVYSDIAVGIYLIIMEIKNKIPLKKWLIQFMLWFVFYVMLILAFVLPYLEMFRFYTQNGSTSEVSEEYSKMFSVDLIRFFIMISSTIFGQNPNASLTQIGSTGMDWEIFMGTIVLALIIYGCIKCRRDYRVKSSIYMMIGTVIYTISGNYDVLTRLFRKIPVLGSMRVPSRALFIFTFFGLVITAVSLDYILKKQDLKGFKKVIILFLLFYLGIIASTYSVISVLEENLSIDYTDLGNRYLKTLLILIFTVVILNIVPQIKKWRKYIAIMLFVILTIVDLYPYWIASDRTYVEVFSAQSDIEKFLISHKEDGKVLLNVPYSITFEPDFGQALGIQTINSYSNMNNPKLLFLLNSGLTTAAFNNSNMYSQFRNLKQNLGMDNDILSMLGVRYIVNTEDEIVPDGKVLGSVYNTGEKVISVEDLKLDEYEGTAICSIPIVLKSDTNYEIDFELNGNYSGIEMLYLDFYGGSEYDLSECQKIVILEEGKTKYKFIINSGLIPDSVESYYLRFIMTGDNSGFTIKKCQVEICEYEDNPYKLVFEEEIGGELYQIFENTKSKDILYASESVLSLSDDDDIYSNDEEYNHFDSNSYIYNFDEVIPEKTEVLISDIDFEGNYVTAKVVADDTAFINFSQAYYPGWRAYVDGKRVQDYEVNGYIQGCVVPQGEHEVCFRFVPMSLYIGTVLSFISFFVLILLSIKLMYSNQENSNEKMMNE